MRKYSKIVSGLLFLIVTLSFVNGLYAANLKQVSATPSNVTAGNTVSYTIIFETTTVIPNDGKITILFPDGFDVSGATFTSWTGFDGGQNVAINTQTITVTRDGAGTPAAAGVKTIVLGNIVNSSTVADDYRVTVTTKNAADGTLDGPNNSVKFQIFSTHSETTVGGIYYLRGNAAAAADIGSLSKTESTGEEILLCDSWVQCPFNEIGTYTQTNQINNIYYHIWWRTDIDEGTAGYDTTGVYSQATDESFAVNTLNSPYKVKNHYLYAGKQTLSSPASIFGNAIYNLQVKFISNSKNPVVICFPEQSSFIIINLSDDITLQSLDSDSDGLTDYVELFTYYTNPYESDTDGDGWGDKYEVDNSLDPVDFDETPDFGKLLLKEYSGGGGSFGYSISSISDIDGDGKGDVLIGAYLADPGGRADAGSVYLYSSGTGNLLQQYDGIVAGDYFGYSVSSISDIDGDGKDDVLIGAINTDPGVLSNAGSVYIYSSGTGNLIKQFDALATGDKLGVSVSSISDIDGDGKDDVVAGAYWADVGGNRTGSTYIFSSDTGNILKQYDGFVAEDRSGQSVSSISDIDGDGKDDVLVGAYFADPGGRADAGSVYLYSSNTSNLLQQYDGLSAGNELSYFALSSISDIDGDGKDDVLIGSASGLPSPGSAYIYSSGTGNLIRQYIGLTAIDSFGCSVSSISDIDGDGKEDVLVGAYQVDPGGIFKAGSAYIYSSSTGDLIKQYNGSTTNKWLGYVVSSIPDVDGDGKDDVLTGTYVGVGSVYIYSSTGNIIDQSWAKGASNNDVFDLDDYFVDSDNSTIPARNQTVTYTASTADNPVIDVSIDSNNIVSFSQPAGWAGTEEVVFTATDSTGLSSQSNTVTLTVTGVNNTYDISGQVLLNNEDPANVTDVVLTLSGNATATTNPDENGNYSFTGLQGYYNYQVTPSLENHRFLPSYYSYTPLDSDETEQNFAGYFGFESEKEEKVKCFIATAAYGTPMTAEVRVLRQFRNKYLLANPLGKVFVDSYCKLSPPVAHFIREHPILKGFVRSMLYPLIWMGEENME